MNIIEEKIKNTYDNNFEIIECGKYMKDKIKLKHNKCGSEFEYNSATDFCKDKAINLYLKDDLCPVCGSKTNICYYERVKLFKEMTNTKIIILDEDIPRKSNENSKLKCVDCGEIWEGNIKNIIQNLKDKKMDSTFGCPKCSNKKSFSSKSYQELLNKKFNNKVTLLSEYINANSYVILQCNHCLKEKKLRPNGIMKYTEDTICDCGENRKSLAEITIMNYLNSLNIPFLTEFAFPNLKHKALLRFDFIIFTKNKFIMIEFDGEHHSKENSLYFSNECIVRDNMKNDYCKLNDIPLLRLSYIDLKNKTLIKKLYTFLKDNNISEAQYKPL